MYNDGSYGIERPLTTACGGGPKGEALIGHDVISSVVEKSPMEETRTTVHDYPKYSPAGAPCRRPTRQWRLATEKFPARETETTVHDYPKYLPAQVLRP